LTNTLFVQVGAGPLHEMSDPCGIDPLA